MNEMSVTTPIIRQRGDRLFTTSLDVAEKFGKRHAHVLSSIRKLCVDCAGFNEPKNRLVNEPKIGDVNRFASNFKETAYIDDKGEQRPMFEMTRAGFSVLAMGFTGKKALEWKIKYEEAFSSMEAALLRQANLSWQDQRSQGKIARREITDTVKAFIAYAESQGSKNAHHYYKHITTATYKALFIVRDKGGKSFRDLLDSMQLSFLAAAEYVAAKALEDGMREQIFYKDIYQLAKQRIESFAVAIPRSNVIAIQASLPGRLHQLEAPA